MLGTVPEPMIGRPMRSRISVFTAAVLALGLLAPVPAAAAPSIKTGVVVTATPDTLDEGAPVTVDAVYDETYKGSVAVTVVDVPPVLDPVDDIIAGKGIPYDLGLPFVDPGSADTHQMTVEWGDGAIDTFDLAVGDRTPTTTHTYGSRGGPLAASVTVEDTGNGASSVETFSVMVGRVCAGQPVTIDMRDLAVTAVIGTPGDDVILGTSGSDSIDGEGGDDTVCAQGGDDTVEGGEGADDLRGGAGDDVLGGGPGDDELRGGPGFDHLDGDEGDDYLDGGGHDDSVFGNDGNDTLRGGYGEDRLIGGLGDDELNGGGGNDVLRGAAGNDVLRGANAADELFGGAGDDVLLGGRGPDHLEGLSQNDILHGGVGADDLFGGPGTDLLFVSEDPDRDSMDGGTGDDAVRVGKTGTLASGIRNYATEAEALAFQGSYLLSEFTTYHSCCENRVINIQLMADSVGGHIVMPGESFSVNAVVGKRTTAKGYKPAGAIIGGYVQCCEFPENIGGGTSQFATTFYNAIFFAAMEDLEHQPHTAWFSRYPQGREATMGYPHPDVRFRNNTDHPVLITTHHDGYRGKSIGVKFWGDNGQIDVTAGSKILARYNKIVRWNVNTGLSNCTYPGPEGNKSGAKQISVGTDGFSIEVYQYIDYPNGDEATNITRWRYAGNYEVWEYNPYEPAGGCGGPPPPPPPLPPGPTQV